MDEDKTYTAVNKDGSAIKSSGVNGDIIKKLHEEKERLENEIRQEYRNARKYVRSHPEEGLAYSFIGGVVFGFILAKIFSR